MICSSLIANQPWRVTTIFEEGHVPLNPDSFGILIGGGVGLGGGPIVCKTWVFGEWTW